MDILKKLDMVIRLLNMERERIAYLNKIEREGFDVGKPYERSRIVTNERREFLIMQTKCATKYFITQIYDEINAELEESGKEPLSNPYIPKGEN